MTDAPLGSRRREDVPERPDFRTVPAYDELGDLDLDLGDLGSVAPGRVTSAPPPVVAPFAPGELLAPYVPLESLASVAPQVPSESLPRLAPSAPAPRVAPTSRTAREPLEVQSLVAAFPEASREASVKGPLPAPREPVQASAFAEMPAGVPEESVPTLRKDEDPSLPPPTHFSSSVSHVRAQLDSSDELAPPEDFPGREGEFDAASVEPIPWLRGLRERFSVRGERAREELSSLAREKQARVRERILGFWRARTERAKVSPKTVGVAAAPSRGSAAPRKREPRARTWSFQVGLPPRRFLPPIAAIFALGAVYGGTTLVLRGAPPLPFVGGPSVPDLGELPGAAPSASPSKSEESPRDFRANRPEAGAKKEASAPAAPGAPPQIETGPFEDNASFPGKSMIEIVTAEDELIYVDGVFIGRGPLRKMPVSPGEHVVSIRSGGAERRGILTAEAGKTSRALFVQL